MKHLNIHHKDDKHFFCADCCECVSSMEELNQHQVDMHSNKKQLTHTCQQCGEEFYFKYKLDEHMFQHTGVKAHKCEKCSMAFVSRKELERHIADHSMEVSFHCNTCDQNFASIQDLQAHVTLHAGRGKFMCNECKLTFKWKSQLKAHMVTHSDIRSFPCNTCGKEFKRVKDLKRHVRVYHETNPPYTCTECNQDFHTPLNLMKHDKSFHGVTSSRGYECHYCSGAFKLKEDLDRHIKIHQAKPYVCSTCSKEFSKLKFIKKHLSLKHGVEEAVEHEHYTKIKNENDDDMGDMDGSQDMSYDGIHDMSSYDASQEGSYVEMQTAVPMDTEQSDPNEMQQIEIVPLSGNSGEQEDGQTQIIIESVQGASQTNIQPAANISSNVSIPKVVMIRGGGVNSGTPSQNQVTGNLRTIQYGQQTSQQNTNRLTTENILLQLAQTAQMQKPMPAHPKLPAVAPLQNIVNVSASQAAGDYVNVVPVSMIPSVVQAEVGEEEDQTGVDQTGVEQTGVEVPTPIVRVEVLQGDSQEDQIGSQTVQNF